MNFKVCLFFLVISFFHVAVIGAEEKVRIGVIFGEASYSSKGTMLDILGARMAVEELDSEGGLLDKEIELIELDNKNTPLGSKAAAQKAVQEGVIAVIGPSSSSHAIVAGPVLQEAKIPMISYVSTNPEVTLNGDYIFRICFTDTLQSEILARFAIEDLKAKTCVVLTCSNEKYSVGLSRIFVDYFRQKGGTILWEGKYLDEATEFKDLLKNVENLKPDIVFLPGYDRASGFIIKQARNMGITAVFFGGDAWSNSLYQYGERAIEGSYYIGHWNVNSEAIEVQEFVNRYKNDYPDNEIVIFGLIHDAFFLLADAVMRAKSLDRTKICDALAKTVDFHGVTGNITMDENRDPIKSVAIFKFENGTSTNIRTISP